MFQTFKNLGKFSVELSLSVLAPFLLVSLTLMYPSGHQSPQIVNPIYYERVVSSNLPTRKPKGLVLKNE